MTNPDDVEFIMEVVDTDPKFIKEVIDLTKENDPESIKEIPDLTKDAVKVEVVDLMDSDPKFIKEIIDLTSDNNPTLIKKIIQLKKEIVDMGGVIQGSMLKELQMFDGGVDVENKHKIVKEIIDLTNDDDNLKFIKEIIDMTKHKKRKKRKRKQEIQIIKTEKKKKMVKKLDNKKLKIARKNSELLKKNLYKFELNTMLNKPQYFNLGMPTKNQIFDKIIEGLQVTIMNTILSIWTKVKFLP